MTDRPLRILHLVAGSDAGGVSRYLLDLYAGMEARGHQLIVVGQRGAWHDKFERANVRWLDLPLKGGFLSQWKTLAALRTLLSTYPVDLIHTHYRRATLIGRKLQAHWPVPLLYTLHLSHMPMTWGRRWLTDFGDHVHVASAQARRWVLEEKFATEDAITLIPHGVNPDKFPLATDADRAAARARFGLPPDATVAAYVGRLDWPKNEDWLLDVLDRCDAHLLVAGDGPHEAAFREAVARRGLSARVHLLGNLDDPLPVYQAADAALLPSEREGFSYVNAEAMCGGTPMIRTNTSGAEDLIEQGVDGAFTAVERAAFVAEAAAFLSDRGRLRDMAAPAAKKIRGAFTLETQIERTEELYQCLSR